MIPIITLYFFDDIHYEDVNPDIAPEDVTVVQ